MSMKSVALGLLALCLVSVYLNFTTRIPSSSIGLAALLMASATGLAWRGESPKWVVSLTVVAGLLTVHHTYDVRDQ